MSFNQEFTIHPIGQGLFYSGKITHRNQVKFRMVFDCGSRTKGVGEEVVKCYREPDFTDKNVLDLLVISHFDEDHVKFIGKLLEGGIKIKRLVMPFATFSERLFLVLRRLYYRKSSTGPNPDNDFFIKFTIDPLGTLNDNLEGDSEVFLIENDPNTDPTNTETDNTSREGDIDYEQRFEFDFDKDDKELTGAEFLITKTPKSKVYKIKDSKKGYLYTSNLIKLMDFIFYKQSIGTNEGIFYDEVKRLFFERFSISDSLSEEKLLESVVSHVKEIKSGKQVKALFNKAKENIKFATATGINISNLNTTALCLLHRNLKGILILSRLRDIELHKDFFFFRNSIYNLQKFSIDGPEIKTNNVIDRFTPQLYYNPNKPDTFIYPNVLLTSDSFLLTSNQVDAFLNHYKSYLNDFWLFQVPHHGSKRNSNALLHARIPAIAHSFINYGINNGEKHPDNEVILDLVKTGNSAKLIGINQYNGLVFSFGR
ncbi:MAG: hypothetical protein MUF45_15465 [Spirosomaceae bacterium]|jgi:hypothetical protein|nr:hypothetical protein [Spirosomataceae bacterium]